MDPIAQMFLQLGIAGAMLFVFYKLGGKALSQQREAEKERTQAIAGGFSAITSELRSHAEDEAERDRVTHVEIATFKGIVGGMMDAADRLTPVAGVPIAASTPTPTREAPRQVKRESPAFGVRIVQGGGYHEQRGKRGGGDGE